MAVKNASTKRQQKVSDADVAELTLVLGETLHALKQTRQPPDDLKAALEEASLAPRHVPALLTLAIGGPLSVSDLAKRVGLGLPTTSTIVGELSRAGLVERAEDENDRRRTIVRLHGDQEAAMTEWAHERSRRFAPRSSGSRPRPVRTSSTPCAPSTTRRRATGRSTPATAARPLDDGV